MEKTERSFISRMSSFVPAIVLLCGSFPFMSFADEKEEAAGGTEAAAVAELQENRGEFEKHYTIKQTYKEGGYRLKKIIITTIITLLMLFIALISSFADKVNSPSDISEEEFIRLYGTTDCLDSYFPSWVYYYGATYEKYLSLGNECFDEKGKLVTPFLFTPEWAWGFDQNFVDTVFDTKMNDIQKIVYYRNCSDIVWRECFVAPWTLYDRESFYTWNDLMKMTDSQLSKIHYDSFTFKKFISSVKNEMDAMGLWKDEYESLFDKLNAHKDDYDKAHEGELYWTDKDGEKIYLSEIIYEYEIKNNGKRPGGYIESPYHQYDELNNIYTLNIYTEEFADWFIQNKDKIDDGDFKTAMLEFCSSVYTKRLYGGEFTYNLMSPFIDDTPPFVKMPDGSDQAVSLRLLYEDYRDGILTKEQIKDVLEYHAFATGTRGLQQYYPEIVTLSWNELLEFAKDYVRGNYIILYDTEYADKPDFRYSENRDAVLQWSVYDFTKYRLYENQLKSVENPKKLYDEMLEFRDEHYSELTWYGRDVLNANIEAMESLIPDTGENTDIIIFSVIAAIALLGMGTVILKGKRTKAAY